MSRPKTLKAFLASARVALTAPPSERPKPLTFVIGNESAGWSLPFLFLRVLGSSRIAIVPGETALCDLATGPIYRP